MRSTVLSLSLALAGCAAAPQPAVRVPESLAPLAPEALAMIVPAKGVQIYECRAAKAGGLEWSFVAPEAELFDANGKTIGRHYAGPHWESNDGSRILGTVKQRIEAPEAGAIPWLLLDAKSVGPEGAFSRVTSIQRVETVGGVAPAGRCSQAGSRAYIPYSADYYFFTTR